MVTAAAVVETSRIGTRPRRRGKSSLLTEFLARFSARRPLLVLTLWAVLTLVAGAISIKLLDSATTTELKLTGGAESEIAGRLLEERLRGPEPLIELVVVQSDAVTVDDPEFEAKVQSVSVVVVAAPVIAATYFYFETKPA